MTQAQERSERRPVVRGLLVGLSVLWGLYWLMIAAFVWDGFLWDEPEPLPGLLIGISALLPFGAAVAGLQGHPHARRWALAAVASTAVAQTWLCCIQT